MTHPQEVMEDSKEKEEREREIARLRREMDEKNYRSGELKRLASLYVRNEKHGGGYGHRDGRCVFVRPAGDWPCPTRSQEIR